MVKVEKREDNDVMGNYEPIGNLYHNTTSVVQFANYSYQTFF